MGLSEEHPEERFARYPVRPIIDAVANYYALSPLELFSARRSGGVARPRQVAMYLARHCTGRSFPDIGRRLGGRDHTTIMHGVKVIESLIRTDAVLADDVARLRAFVEQTRALVA